MPKKKKKKIAKRSAPKRKQKKAAPKRAKAQSRAKKATRAPKKSSTGARPRERGSRLREFEPPTRQQEREEAAADSAGQSGDTQGLSASELADNESVQELVEEGQSFEAEAVSGVENAPDADQGEIKTHELPEDDIPDEYRNSRENN